MESEKIKEIKKGLECCYSLDLRECHKCPYGDIDDCKHDQLMQDVISLINELESENEKLKNIGLNENITIGEYLRRMQQLETENAKLKQHKEELQGGQQDLIRNFKEVVPQTRKLTVKEIIDFVEEKDKKAGKFSIYKKLLEELKEKFGEVL